MTTALNPIGIGTTPGDATGDPTRVVGMKIKSDHAIFLSAIGRRPTKPGTFGTTSGAGSATVLNDTSQSWATNQFQGQTLTITTGSLPSQGVATSDNAYSGVIASNTATQITLASALPFTIGSGVGYQISPNSVTAGSDGFATSAGGSAPSTLPDANQSWTVNQWAGLTVTLLAGAYAGQWFGIVSNSSNALTLAAALATPIAAGTPYVIGALPNSCNSVSASPATSVNDYAPTGWGPGINRLLLAAAAGGSTLTGLLATGIQDNAQVLLRNTSTTDNLILAHQSGSSGSANQFSLPGAQAVELPPLTNALLIYIVNAWTLLL